MHAYIFILTYTCCIFSTELCSLPTLVFICILYINWMVLRSKLECCRDLVWNVNYVIQAIQFSVFFVAKGSRSPLKKGSINAIITRWCLRMVSYDKVVSTKSLPLCKSRGCCGRWFSVFSPLPFVPAEWFAKRAFFFLRIHTGNIYKRWYTIHFQNCFPILSLHNLISLQRAGGHLINNWCWLLFGVPTFLRAWHFIRTICCRRQTIP